MQSAYQWLRLRPDGEDPDTEVSAYASSRSEPIRSDIYYPASADGPEDGDEVRYSLEGTDTASFDIDGVDCLSVDKETIHER